MLTAARQMYEGLAQERDPTFKLPKMVDLVPEVWEHLERTVTGNQAITKCRACGKKFDSQHGEVVCSKKCEEKHQAAQDGLVCQICSQACPRKKMFYDPVNELWYPTELLQREYSGEDPEKRWEEAMKRLFPDQPDVVKFLIDTKRQKNPVIFCSETCEQKYFHQSICQRCGGTDAVAYAFPDIDEVQKATACLLRGDEEGQQRAFDRLDSHSNWIPDWCKKCCAAAEGSAAILDEIQKCRLERDDVGCDLACARMRAWWEKKFQEDAKAATENKHKHMKTPCMAPRYIQPSLIPRMASVC